MKELSRFWHFFPNFSSFFPILPLFFLIFGKIFAVRGGTLPPVPPSGYATDICKVKARQFCWIANFQLNTLSLPNFAFYPGKSPSVTQRSASQENFFKRANTHHLFFLETTSSNNSLTLIENNFRFLR